MKEDLKKYLVELIGSYFLVLTIACSCIFGFKGIAPAFAIGWVLMVVVYAGGHISGGHYNPAVSLSACLRGVLSKKHFLFYSIIQILGGVLAALTFMFLIKGLDIPMQPAALKISIVLIAEFLFTFLLCYTVLQTATTKSTNGNSYYGLAIGSSVSIGIFSVGAICAAAFNPAVAVSLAILNLITWKIAGYTILANLLAGAAAAGVFKLTYTEPSEE